jgi:hypothetical protein
MKQQQSITSLPPSPDAERRARMIKYTIAMTIRVACIFALLFAKGWWLAVFAAGAIFLPYVAVVLANVGGPSRSPEVLRPGGLVPVTPPPVGSDEPAGQPEAGPAGPAASDWPDPAASDRPDPSAPDRRDPATSDRPDDERGAA